jgi:hypothetical protein
MRATMSWRGGPHVRRSYTREDCSTLSMALIHTAAHIHHGWSLGELVLSDMSIGVSFNKSVELLNLYIILACMVEMYKALRNLPRLLNLAYMLSTAAPMMYHEKTMNS